MKQTMVNNLKYYQLRDNILLKILHIISKQKSAPIGGTVLIGDSLVELIPGHLLSENYINNGIGGMCSAILCNLVDELVNKFKPKRVILHIGTNDLGDTVMESPRDIIMNIRDLIDMIQANNNCDITLVSCLICNESVQASWVLNNGIRSNELIRVLNRELSELASYKGIDYMDLDSFMKSKDKVEDIFLEDGLHLNEMAYVEIINYIKNNYSKMI